MCDSLLKMLTVSTATNSLPNHLIQTANAISQSKSAQANSYQSNADVIIGTCLDI